MNTPRPHASNAAVRRLAISQGLAYAGRGAALTALIWALYAATGSAWWLSGAMLVIFGAATAVSPWSTSTSSYGIPSRSATIWENVVT